jgi:superfamily II RNA helicase
MFLQIPDAMVAPPWPPSELALPTNYELDPFQKHAVLGIHAGDHVFVTAKTGSGKTFVGEYLIAYWLAKGKRVFYTTPIKSLSNQKYHDLKNLFPNATVGILTGDIKMCPDAQIVVMTAEILRNLLYKRGTATESVGLTAAVSLEGVCGVVMDEVHYIQDPDRGHVWEESLILCPSKPVVADTADAVVATPIQLVLLSATLPSAPGGGSRLRC